MKIINLKIKLNILAWCIEDWTSLFTIVCFIKEFYKYKNLELLKKTTLNIIQSYLDEDIIKAGDLHKNKTFTKWNKTTSEIILEIKKNWDSLKRDLLPEEIVWFDITEKGKKEFEYLKRLPELKETDPFYLDDK
jgi:hypothetical protein